MSAVKPDENLGTQLLLRTRETGLDAESVRTEGLTSAADDMIFAHCRSEGRTLITLDLDFSNPLRFPPTGGPGTIVLRPHRPSHVEISDLFDEALARLRSETSFRNRRASATRRVQLLRS